MAYRFKFKETPEEGVCRIAGEQTAKILARLSVDRGEAVTLHESRKALKRLKALLKLVRACLPRTVYQDVYGRVRTVSADLSLLRDLDVMPQTLALLAAARPEISDPTRNTIRTALMTAAPKTAEATRRELIAVAIKDVEALDSAMSDLALGDATFKNLSEGVAAGLVRLRQDRARALESHDDEAYHDWRKSAQLHWRQLRLISFVWPEAIEVRVKAAKALAATLGHDHDLTVLAGFIDGLPARQLKAPQRHGVERAIRTRQQALRAEARAHAHLLVDLKPGQFARKLKHYHRARRAAHKLERPLVDIFETEAAASPAA